MERATLTCEMSSSFVRFNFPWHRHYIIVGSFSMCFINILTLLSEKTVCLALFPCFFPDKIAHNLEANRIVTEGADSNATFENGSVTSHEDGPHSVLILAYLRSGSSFTAGILDAAPDTFYSYEPLRYMEHMERSGPCEDRKLSEECM